MSYDSLSLEKRYKTSEHTRRGWAEIRHTCEKDGEERFTHLLATVLVTEYLLFGNKLTCENHSVNISGHVLMQSDICHLRVPKTKVVVMHPSPGTTYNGLPKSHHTQHTLGKSSASVAENKFTLDFEAHRPATKSECLRPYCPPPSLRSVSGPNIQSLMVTATSSKAVMHLGSKRFGYVTQKIRNRRASSTTKVEPSVRRFPEFFQIPF